MNRDATESIDGQAQTALLSLFYEPHLSHVVRTMSTPPSVRITIHTVTLLVHDGFSIGLFPSAALRR